MQKIKNIIKRLRDIAPLYLVGWWAFVTDKNWAWPFYVCFISIMIVIEMYRRIRNCKVNKNAYVHMGLLGISSVWSAWALSYLHDTLQGKMLIMLGVVMVVVFDSASMIFGQFLPKRLYKQIAPHESPNKTLGGVVCGTVACIGAGIAFLDYMESRYGSIGIDRQTLYVTMIILPAVAYYGDINESMAKRRIYQPDEYGYVNPNNRKSIKDFSNFLGSHGGFADRFDAMFMVFFLIGFVWTSQLAY